MLHEFLTLMDKGTWWIMWPLFAIGVVLWSIGIDRWAFLRRFHRARRRFINSVRPILSGDDRSVKHTGYVHYDILIDTIASSPFRTEAHFKNLFRQFLISTVPDLERHFSTISAWIYVAPLMGLLGTVIGMIKTFQTITLFGGGNPNLMAEGIGVALLTTQAGLIVAFPALLMQVFLSNKKNALVSAVMKDGDELLKLAAEKRWKN
jgi:biopolymer transport protein ExbB